MFDENFYNVICDLFLEAGFDEYPDLQQRVKLMGCIPKILLEDAEEWGWTDAVVKEELYQIIIREFK